jgi:diguanylate cyclase
MIDETSTGPENPASPDNDQCGSLTAALEYLIDGLQVPAEYRPRLLELKQQLSALDEQLPPASIIQEITTIAVAAQRQFDEFQSQHVQRVAQLEEELEEMARSLQSAEQQTQSSFQASQKVGITLERQVQDMESRLRRGGKSEGLKSAMQQSIAVVKARLEDYQEQGGQQFSQMSSQMQGLAGKLTEIESWTGEFREAVQATQLQLQEDALTGIAGRVALESALSRRLSEKAAVALVVWDMDGFRTINKKYGREAGDRTLQLVSGILQRRLRDEDFIARYGRDRFVVILNESNGEVVGDIAERLHAAISEAEFHSHGRPLSLSVSGGIALARDGDDVAKLMKRAMASLREAKEQGGNRLCSAS